MKNLKKYIKAIIFHLKIIKSLFTEQIDEDKYEDELKKLKAKIETEQKEIRGN